MLSHRNFAGLVDSHHTAVKMTLDFTISSPGSAYLLSRPRKTINVTHIWAGQSVAYVSSTCNVLLQLAGGIL